jgi:multidrug efflux system membrane fusion protein
MVTVSTGVIPVTRRQKQMIPLILIVTAIATAIYVTRWRDVGGPAGAGFGRGAHGGGPPVPVRVVVASRGPIDMTLDALGTVSARNTAVVRTRVDGLLQKINFQEGREVKAGDVLAQLDPRPYVAALDQALGQLARDNALLASARNNLERYQTLLALDSIAKQQVDDQAELVHQYEGTVQTDAGLVSTARLNLDWTRISAPITGRLGLKQADVGNVVHTTDVAGVVLLTQTAPINVVFAIPADRAPEALSRWRGGQHLKVEAYDRDGTTRLAVGTLESTDNVVDPTTSTVKLKGVFDNADGNLFPNQFVNARLTLATLTDQTLVKASAVQRGTPGTFVYVVNEDNTASVRPVTVITTFADTSAIAKGLKPGDRVVIDGTDKLKEGAKVAIAAETPAPDAAHAGNSKWGGGAHAGAGHTANGGTHGRSPPADGRQSP